MNVHGIGQGAGQGAAVREGAPSGGARRKGEIEKAAEPSGGVTAGPALPAEQSPKGVIRLLEEGHFKGVADVRLRINFFDEVSALEHERQSEVGAAAVPELLAQVNASIGGLLSSGDLDEGQAVGVLEAQEAFGASVQALLDEFLVDGASGPDALTGGLRVAFDTLAESLRPIIAGPAPSGEADPDEAAEGVDPASDEDLSLPASAFLDELEAEFGAGLEEFAAGLESSAALPGLSPPPGNGAAYGKFLEIYNELRGSASAKTEAETPAEGVDLLV